MNSSVINSSQPFNHSSSGSSLLLLNTVQMRSKSRAAILFLVIERIINLVVGYPANFMVMWLVAREKSDSSTSDIFVFNLAIADALLSLITVISCYGRHILKIMNFTDVMAFTTGIKNSSPLFLACICLDRYVAVVHPIVFTNTKDNKIRMAISMLVWGLMITYGFCRALVRTLAAHIYIGMILAAFVIMVFCNVSIVWSLRKSVLGKEKVHPMKKKALRIVQIYLAIIVFHYLPVVVVSLFPATPDFPHLSTVEMILFSVMYYSATTAPLLYISLIKQLPWLKNLPCICCRSTSPEEHNVST